MITQPAGSVQTEPRSWQRALSDLIVDPRELLGLLEIDESLLPAMFAAGETFPLRVPREFVARMQKGDIADPLLRQVLPVGDELARIPGFTGDPLAESQHVRQTGLLQKYQGRVLAIAAGTCAVNCRYCFRRHFPYDEHVADSQFWERLRAAVAEDPSIEEVILSGGEPLLLNNRRLAWIVQALAAIPHIRRLRIHSRLPVVIPARVDTELPGILSGTRLPCVLVLHANHAREIDDEVAAALSRLCREGIVLLNQSVLLRGVNDSAEALAMLSERLLSCRVVPYYLHLLDPVAGAAHFNVGEGEATRLLHELSARLPGYLVPRLVREIPGAPGKTPVTARW